MRIFDVSGCRAEIVRPSTNLTVWAAQNKPFAVCNASLYDMRTHVPIGTIVEDGKYVHNDGNGYGCGVTWTDGTIQFGQPWDKTWKEYLTGYNSPVQGGQYVAPNFSDSYVFGCRLVRIGIGTQNGKTVIVTDDFATLKEFAEHAIAQGIDTLVNLDGGGSRHLYYDGATVYSSPRIPYNAIAFYKTQTTEKPKESIAQCPYPEPTRNLVYGRRGDDVKWMQWHLQRHGFDCSIDGVFGWETWRAVWNFQKTWSKAPDGICGPNTRRELKK
jgi:hypothetical protein